MQFVLSLTLVASDMTTLIKATDRQIDMDTLIHAVFVKKSLELHRVFIAKTDGLWHFVR